MFEVPPELYAESRLFRYYLKHQDDDTLVVPNDALFSCEDIVPTSTTFTTPPGFNKSLSICQKAPSLPEGPLVICRPVFWISKNALYVGQFDGGMINGHGLLIFRDGSFCEGQFTNNQFTGFGFRYYSKDLSYTGRFKDFKKHGEGKLYGPKGIILTSKFAGDQIKAPAKILYPDGATYKGELSGLKKHGFGKFTLPNGNFYKGSFRDDLFHGVGEFVETGKNISYQGSWDKNKLLSSCKVVYSESMMYEGDVEHFQKHGCGRLKSHGKVYEGRWENDLKEGVFKIWCENPNDYKMALFERDNFQRYFKAPATIVAQQAQLSNSVVEEPSNCSGLQKPKMHLPKKRCNFFCL